MNAAVPEAAAGVTPEQRNLQDLLRRIVPGWRGELRAGRAINLSHLDDLPPQAISERQRPAAWSIQSLLVLPLVRRGTPGSLAGAEIPRRLEQLPPSGRGLAQGSGGAAAMPADGFAAWGRWRAGGGRA